MFSSEPAERKQYNEKLFTIVAPRYDVATRLLSFGQDVRWKRTLIDSLPALSAPHCLDIACGSGDLTVALADKYPRGHVLGVDLTAAMVARARQKHSRRNVEFRVEDMCALQSVASSSVDIVTGGYALRNAQELPRMLYEVGRVLKEGGTAAFLEFSNADCPVKRSFHQVALNGWGGFCGLMLHGRPAVYRYIPRTLRTFPNRRELTKLMSGADLEATRFETFMFGMIEISFWRKSAPYTQAARPRSEPPEYRG
jgi:ubiquinone/menaquinone biosynthesis methyltransferase